MSTIHVITPEYPPTIGGVSDYTRQVARGLSDAGDLVHVWCPGGGDEEATGGIVVHRALGTFSEADLRRADDALNALPAPRRILVQWVPHGYGRRSMNLAFCLWLRRRAEAGDRVELMVHEPFLEFAGSVRQRVAAGVHRVMTIVLLRSAAQVWLSIPAWESRLRPYALGRNVPFTWLPIPAALERPAPESVASVRRELGGERGCLIGHVSTYGSLISTLLDGLVPDLLRTTPEARLLLIGAHGEAYASVLIDRYPDFRGRIITTGYVDAAALAAHIAACHVLVQPYPDGVSARRTTTMAGLSLGVPVVTTSGHLTESFWEGSRAIRLSDVGDWNTFNGHVRRLLSSPEERCRLSVDARRFYDEHFAVHHTISSLRSVA